MLLQCSHGSSSLSRHRPPDLPPPDSPPLVRVIEIPFPAWECVCWWSADVLYYIHRVRACPQPNVWVPYDPHDRDRRTQVGCGTHVVLDNIMGRRDRRALRETASLKPITFISRNGARQEIVD